MPRMPTVMEHSFSRVPPPTIERSTFDRSHGVKTTFDASQIIPIFVDEALPGDTFNLSMQGFARLATPLKPLMDNLMLETFFFAVPYRLVWLNWKKFMGEQVNPGDSTSFVPPKFSSYVAASLSLSDYLGLQVGNNYADTSVIPTTSLFHRAYNLIYNEWFRDQNIQTAIVVDVDDGPDLISDYVVRKACKKHDYFTSCLPWPQRGTLQLLDFSASVGAAPTFQNLAGTADQGQLVAATTADQPAVNVNSPTGSWTAGDVLRWDNPSLSISVNSLRQSFQLQKLQERDARGGARYTEMIRAHFGVVSPDARMQRPEYLGGGRTPVIVSPVAQTTAMPAVPTGNDARGHLSGIGTASWRGHGFVKSFTEHCMLLGLVVIRPDITYQTGVSKMFTRSTRFDYFWPALAHIGEQSVKANEIYHSGLDTNDDVVFGYQERYAEYRYKPSMITGLFRSDVAGSLDVWHLSEDFDATPALNSTFITDPGQTVVDRVIAVPAEPQFLFDAYISLKCARPMPVFGVPGMIDRF